MFLIHEAPPVWTAARPRAGHWLCAELHTWKTAGAAHVVSMLTAFEEAELGLLQEADEARQMGLLYTAIPVFDRQTPPSSRRFHTALAPVRTSMRSGRGVVVHCRQGIGRASLAAAALLLDVYDAEDDIWQRIEAVRGRPVPDTPAQRRWLRAYAAWRRLQGG
jgi:protein-tyrosine phosphatase